VEALEERWLPDGDPLVYFSGDYVVDEGAETATIGVYLDHTSESDVTVLYDTGAGPTPSATANDDYAQASWSVCDDLRRNKLCTNFDTHRGRPLGGR
jgi:hypothetical protein